VHIIDEDSDGLEQGDQHQQDGTAQVYSYQYLHNGQDGQNYGNYRAAQVGRSVTAHQDVSSI
jgi:hypothetical protein